MPCSLGKITSLGLDIGSVNCGLGIIRVWGDADSMQLNIESSGHVTRKVPGGVSATSVARIKLVDSMAAYCRDEAVDIAGVEGFTNQPRSFTAFSIGEMGGYVRSWIYRSDIKHAVIIPPVYLNTLCGAGGRGLKPAQRKYIIGHYLEHHCGLKGDSEHEMDALGFAWIACLVLIFRNGGSDLVRHCLGDKIRLIQNLQHLKYWL